MITGDQLLTAKAIAERLKIFNEDTKDVKTGHDLETLSEEQFIKMARDISVYARVSPEQKLKIVYPENFEINVSDPGSIQHTLIRIRLQDDKGHVSL